jgi:RNA-splicing ligase RtcB
MIELQGKFGKDCKIFTNAIENEAIGTIQNILNNPVTTGVPVRIMPDTHQGVDIVIGFTMPVTDRVNPNHIGVDIGCGMLCVEIENAITEESFPDINHAIRSIIPMGFEINQQPLSKQEKEDLFTFLSIRMDQFCSKYHAEIAKFDKKAFSNEIQRLKSTVEPQFMQTEILRLKEKFAEYSGYLTNEAMLHYLCDMVIAQGYAAFNRKLIIQRIIRTLSWNATISVETVHNYISFDDMIIRKGAIAAYANDYVVIPMNMADGILLCRGKGNKDWNYSAPHGAGRLYSRSEAKERLSMDAFKTQMSKVYSTSVCEGTLDESPMAYKNVQEIKELIEPTVEIIDTIVPLINIKAV